MCTPHLGLVSSADWWEIATDPMANQIHCLMRLYFWPLDSADTPTLYIIFFSLSFFLPGLSGFLVPVNKLNDLAKVHSLNNNT